MLACSPRRRGDSRRRTLAVAAVLSIAVGCSSHGTVTFDDSSVPGGDIAPDSATSDGACGADVTSCTNGAPCQDLSVCNGQELCTNGCCRPGQPLNCTSPYNCATGTCEESMGGCYYTLNQALCPPNQRCTSTMGCVDPTTIDCSETGDAVCRALGGNVCDGIFVCDPMTHRCAGTPSGNCDDMDLCTDDSCAVQNNMAVCQHTPNVDLMTDTDNCGTCRNVCTTGPHQTATCTAGVCVDTCVPGWVDANHNPVDGCECDGGMSTDPPDLMFIDSNCDGIDGDATNGVFVDALTGSDCNAGTMASPLQTIQTGIALAASTTLKQVYVSVGSYTGPVTLNDGVSIYGGYDASQGWQRALTNVTLIQSPTAAPAVSGNALVSPAEIQLFTIQSLDTTTLGASSYAVRFTGSNGVITLRGDTIDAGRGGAGIAGFNGLPARPAAQGPAVPTDAADARRAVLEARAARRFVG